jgi:hypothetical protein
MPAAMCPLLGDGITDDTLLYIACFLSSKDLVRLQLTCSRFAVKVTIPAILSSGGEAAVAAAAPEMLSIPEEAARRWVARCSAQERGWVRWRGHESWLWAMHEVVVLRLPLVFDRAHAIIALSENGMVATRSEAADYTTGGYKSAVSKVVMRSGCHYAQFTVEGGRDMRLGVLRPGWDVVGDERLSEHGGDCTFYSTFHGNCEPRYTDWKGMSNAREQGDRIGMLLDLDQGSMSVWKNDEKMGVMVAEGLSGPLSWGIFLGSSQGSSARIESAAAPTSPTEEELVAAMGWDRRNLLQLPQTATDAECVAAEAAALAAALARREADAAARQIALARFEAKNAHELMQGHQ